MSADDRSRNLVRRKMMQSAVRGSAQRAKQATTAPDTDTTDYGEQTIQNRAEQVVGTAENAAISTARISYKQFRVMQDKREQRQKSTEKAAPVAKSQTASQPTIEVDDMGNLVNPNYISGNFSNILRKNGLRPIRFHDLRHSCASLLIKNKIPMKDVQVWMGHSSFATTANIYAHIDTDSKQEAANMISACISLSGSPDKKMGKKNPPKRSA